MNNNIYLGDLAINNDNPLVIAELGANHNGSVEIAIKMIESAAQCGIKVVKLQTYTPDEFVSTKVVNYNYISEGNKVSESMFDLFARLSLSAEEHIQLFNCAKHHCIDVIATPFGNKSVDLLSDLGVKAFKIASCDLNYTPLIRYIASKQKPIILSTGMSSFAEVNDAVVVMRQNNQKFVLLHCVSIYPTPIHLVNLNRMLKLRDQYNCLVGFSDHSQGNQAAIISASMGASIIEKHFTLDKNMPGPDHYFSADPADIVNLINEIDTINVIKGNGEIALSEQEKEVQRIARRYMVFNDNFVSGYKITSNDIAYKRTGYHCLSHKDSDLIIGKQLNRDVDYDDIVKLEYFN